MMFSLEYGSGGSHGHTPRLMTQDAMGADAWLAIGMRAQGPPGWFQAGLEQCQYTHFLRQVLWFVRLCSFELRGQQCKPGDEVNRR